MENKIIMCDCGHPQSAHIGFKHWCSYKCGCKAFNVVEHDCGTPLGDGCAVCSEVLERMDTPEAILEQQQYEALLAKGEDLAVEEIMQRK